MHIDYVKTPFNNNPSMQKYSGPLLIENPRKIYLDEKLTQLSEYGDDLYGESKIFKENNLIQLVCSTLGLDPKETLKDLSLLIEEDIAVMHKGKLEAISFCFPSGWVPSKGLGEGFTFLHNPVADNELLIKSSEKLTKYMCKNTIQRWVWNITTINGLSNHPKVSRPLLNDFNDLFFRLETQISTPLDNETSLFLVSVEVVNLKEVWDEKILKSLNSMSESILEYKQLTKIKDYLNSFII